MKRIRALAKRRQRGSTLVVALIFLVILGMLGVTVASTNVLQERMAGNTRNRDLAFEAAEHALKDANDEINDATSELRVYIDAYNSSVKNGTAAPPAKGWVRLASAGVSNDADYWKNDFDWSDANASREPETSLDSLAGTQPRYVVDYMGTAVNGSVTNFYYRVTAHGVGGSADNEVILQAMYKF